jgi:quercetin dioxygenase-like cupin family protein
MTSDSSVKRQSLPKDAEGQLSPRAEQLDRPILQFNFREEIASLRREPGYASAGRVARQLAKHPVLRCTLTVIRAGTHIAEHVAPGEAAIHVLEGKIRMQLPGQVAALSSGSMLVLGQGVRHDVTAEMDSAFLASIAVPVAR